MPYFQDKKTRRKHAGPSRLKGYLPSRLRYRLPSCQAVSRPAASSQSPLESPVSRDQMVSDSLVSLNCTHFVKEFI